VEQLKGSRSRRSQPKAAIWMTVAVAVSGLAFSCRSVTSAVRSTGLFRRMAFVYVAVNVRPFAMLAGHALCRCPVF
jgi:hypothetical protein